MKDPAVLFYTQDFLTGTMLMSAEQKGYYITLLCLQHQNGKLSERDMLKICGEKDEDIWGKFILEDGFYINKRMFLEATKRANYSESRRRNRTNTSKTYDSHMENENENENVIKDVIEEKNNTNLEFENFRVKYPGTKRGYQIEFDNFNKKHKDWRKVLPLLEEKLTYQISAREIKRRAGGFVPEWKNLQTWINQRCWEEEISTEVIKTESKKTNYAELNNPTTYIK